MTNSQKTVPYNVDAEEAILGSIIIDPDAYPDVHRTLKAEHLYLQKNRLIYQAMERVVQRGDPLDFLILTTELDAVGQLDVVGGAIYLSQLLNVVPTSINVNSYVRLVIDAAKRREMLDIVTEMARVAYNERDDIATTRLYFQKRLDEIMAGDGPAHYQSFAELAPTLPPITWLWENWVPVGMLTLLGAVPGAGKTLVALDMTRRVIHGITFPDGTTSPYHRTGANVIYVDAEMVPQLLNSHVQAWELNAEKLFLMLPQPNRPINFAETDDQERLRNMAAALRPGLIVIDSLSSINPRGENNIEDVRGILAYLNEIAANYNTSIIIIHHLRKRGGIQLGLPMTLSIDDFRGSSHIIAMSRSVIGLSVVQTTADLDRNGPRKFEVLKTNLCQYPEAMGCEIVKGHPTGVVLKWANEAPKSYREPTKVEQAAAWLRDLLEDGAQFSPKEVVEMGKDEGYSQATVYRARKSLENSVIDTDGRQSPNNKWAWK